LFEDDNEYCLKTEEKPSFLDPIQKKGLFLVLCYLNGKHVFRPPKYKHLFVTWMHTKLSLKTKYLANFKARGTRQETRNRNKEKDISEKHHKRSPRSYFAIKQLG
jgi:hypothetical protein